MTFLGFKHVKVSDLPLSYETILLFLSYLNLKGLAPSTTTTYISAIGYVHKVCNVNDPTSQFIVQKVLASINKEYGKSDSRLPITQFILARLLDSVDKVLSSIYHATLLKAMFLIAFYGLFRVGEITIQSSGVVSLNMDQIQIFKDRFELKITKFKNNLTNKPFDIVIHKLDSPYCPYLGLLKYLQLRKLDNGPLFRFPDGKPVSRSFFANRLKDCLIFCGLNPHLFKSHSFRIGGASFLASIGKTDLQIKIIGRWSSDSFLRYIRNKKFDIFHK